MTSRLIAVLERTLEVKAAQAADVDPAAAPTFDPTRRPSTVGHTSDGGAWPDELDDLDLGVSPLPPGGPRSVRRRRRLLVPAAAACLAAAALAGGSLVLRDGGPHDGAVRTLDLGDPPDGWLLPSWVPEGMEVWGVDTSSYEQQPDDFDPATIPQLFGDPGGERAIYVTSHHYEISPDTATDVAVRGTTGSAGTGWGAAEEELGDAVRWDERGVGITALYRGVTRDEAIAVLDALEWRSDDPLDGFAPPADDAWPLRAEATSRSTVAHDASLIYSDGVPAADPHLGQSGLMVHTSSSSTISVGYLATWYLEGTGDGTDPLVTSRDGREVSVHWPDGRSVIVAPVGAAESSLSLDVLERIATSVTVATTTDLAELRGATATRIEALPVVATADTTIGTVDIHADSGFVRLCLRRPGAPATECDTSTLGGSESPDGSARASAQWAVDGAWSFVIASRGGVPRIFDGSDPSVPPLEAELSAERTTVGDWTVQLVQPGPGVDSICMGSEESMGCTASRSE